MSHTQESIQSPVFSHGRPSSRMLRLKQRLAAKQIAPRAEGVADVVEADAILDTMLARSPDASKLPKAPLIRPIDERNPLSMPSLCISPAQAPRCLTWSLRRIATVKAARQQHATGMGGHALNATITEGTLSVSTGGSAGSATSVEAAASACSQATGLASEDMACCCLQMPPENDCQNRPAQLPEYICETRSLSVKQPQTTSTKCSSTAHVLRPPTIDTRRIVSADNCEKESAMMKMMGCSSEILQQHLKSTGLYPSTGNIAAGAS